MRWVTFDCFGTLVDWRHGITTSADLAFPGLGGRLLTHYLKHEVAVEEESPSMRYRDVLTESLRRSCADEGLDPGESVSVLADTIPHWPVYPEVGHELGALRAAGWRLALLTNCDRDLIAETLRRLPVPFDAVVTAEDVGGYKPAHGHFTRFREVHEPRVWVHVAQSYTHDIVPAHTLGLPRVWINRHGERPSDPSIVQETQPDLHDLVGTVARVSAA
ncbi:HAD-IA family hydrolase [Nonomuraea longicatena]|uniref:HAD family hydrolase n=1 Tax=Nonomuraea longicatena TaxID=83682 RepID=A0ABP4BLX0_9ACTN